MTSSEPTPEYTAAALFLREHYRQRRAAWEEREAVLEVKRAKQRAAYAATHPRVPRVPGPTPREEHAWKLRHMGLTLRVVGTMLGVTPERVRQMEARYARLALGLRHTAVMADHRGDHG